MRMTILLSVLPLLIVTHARAADPLGAPKCTTGELWAGNPVYPDPMMRAADGAGIRTDPPLGWRALVFSGNTLYTTTGQEVWAVPDIAAEKPVQKRIAGKEQTGQQLKGGACKDARFANVFGVTGLSDGSLVGVDQTGNAVFRINDPKGPKCNVELLAGSTKNLDSISPGSPPNVGDKDGPGAIARLSLPEWPVADSNNNVFFIDSGVSKLKRLSNDGAHTVKTIAKLPEAVYHSVIVLKDKVYALANNASSEAFIVEIDPPTGATRDVVKGRAEVFEGSGSINPSGLTTDGKALIMGHSGVILYVTLDGKVKPIAGDGTYFDYKGGYDPLVPHKAGALQLVARRRHMTAGTSTFLAWKEGEIYMGASSKNTYIEKIHCK